MVHLKVQLRFYFKKDKELRKSAEKKMHLKLQLMVHLTVRL